MEDAEITKRLLGVNKTYFNRNMKDDNPNIEWKDEDSFWLPIAGKDEKGQVENTGYVRLGI